MTPRLQSTGGVSLRRLIIVLIVGITPGIAASSARADWFGGGFGFNPFGGPPSSVGFINDAALARIGAAAAAKPQAGVSLSANPNSYFNSTRDADFFNRYDIETRQAMEDRVARRPPWRGFPARPAVATPPQPATSPTPVVAAVPELVAPLIPIASFFNSYKQLVWPGDAPTHGDLGPKRTVSDKACLVVKEETQNGTLAPIALVADARKKLLDYGQPALEFVRTHMTSPISETFHMFLLSLYDSLGQAANPPKAARS